MSEPLELEPADHEGVPLAEGPAPRPPHSPLPGGELRRSDVYPGALVDGSALRRGALARLRARLARVSASADERAEAELECQLRSQTEVTRANTVAVVSPKGGVGKTTLTYIVGNLLASRLGLRVLAVDANADFGTLGALAPEALRSPLSLADMLCDIEELGSSAELQIYLSRLPSGLHLLGAPADPQEMAALGAEDYATLLAFAGRWYELILLDLGAGIAGELAQFALARADQTIVVTTPEWVTARSVSTALRHLRRERATLALNQARPLGLCDRFAIENHFARAELARRVTIPYDEQLRAMLDSATYSLEALGSDTRLAVKRLGLAVAGQLV